MARPDDRAAAQKEDVERTIRAHCEGGRLDLATALLLQEYGREIFRFLMSRLRDEEAATEVFSAFTESLWRGLGGFRWKCPVRVWAYKLARHATSRFIAGVRRRRALEVSLSHAGPLSEIGAKIRTETLVAMRTETKTLFAELCEQLPLDDQSLIVLRVGRKLSWKDIARVMSDSPDADEAPEREIEQASARVRQRFQVVKERLRLMARERGITIDRDERL